MQEVQNTLRGFPGDDREQRLCPLPQVQRGRRATAAFDVWVKDWRRLGHKLRSWRFHVRHIEERRFAFRGNIYEDLGNIDMSQERRLICLEETEAARWVRVQ